MKGGFPWKHKSQNAANFYRAMNCLWDPKGKNSVAQIIGYNTGRKEILGVPKRMANYLSIVN